MRSFGVGIMQGTRNVYIFVPSIHRERSFDHSFSERNFALYLNSFYLYIKKTIIKRRKLITWVYR